jgi:hypothetical protein
MLLAVLLCSATPVAVFADAPTPVDAKNADKFPIPKDASAGKDAPGGGGKIQMYTVPRGRDAVVKEVKEALAKGGWKIEKEAPSPNGKSIRMEVKKGDKLYKVSFTSDGSPQTAIILTLP